MAKTDTLGRLALVESAVAVDGTLGYAKSNAKKKRTTLPYTSPHHSGRALRHSVRLCEPDRGKASRYPMLARPLRSSVTRMPQTVLWRIAPMLSAHHFG